jgi:hypothetical protein
MNTNDMQDLFQQQKKEWLEDCRTVARKLLATRTEITIEDVLRETPRPSYIHKNTTGQVFKHPDFKMCGIARSNRSVSKGRWVMKWTLNAEAFPLTMQQVRRSRQEAFVE